MMSKTQLDRLKFRVIVDIVRRLGSFSLSIFRDNKLENSLHILLHMHTLVVYLHTEQIVTEPVVTEPDATETVVTEPDATEPVVTELVVSTASIVFYQ